MARLGRCFNEVKLVSHNTLTRRLISCFGVVAVVVIAKRCVNLAEIWYEYVRKQRLCGKMT